MKAKFVLLGLVIASLASLTFQRTLQRSGHARYMNLNLTDAEMVKRAISSPTYCQLNSNMRNVAVKMSKDGKNSIQTTMKTFLESWQNEFLKITQEYINSNPVVFSSFLRDQDKLRVFLKYLGFNADIAQKEYDLSVSLTLLPNFSLDSFCDQEYGSRFASFLKSELNPSQTSAVVSYVSNVKQQVPVLMDYLLSVTVSRNVQRLAFLTASDMRIINKELSPALNDFYNQVVASEHEE
jgi:hypothetical protein